MFITFGSLIRFELIQRKLLTKAKYNFYLQVHDIRVLQVNTEVP